jgi:hypothetical protein
MIFHFLLFHSSGISVDDILLFTLSYPNISQRNITGYDKVKSEISVTEIPLDMIK